MIFICIEIFIFPLFFGRIMKEMHAHLKISWVHYQINQKDGSLAYPPPISHNFSPKIPKESSPSPKISPTVLLIIVILAALLFISGILYLLVRLLTKKPQSASSLVRSPQIALQRQLRQLFNLHDSGLDQASIDSLPIFTYKEIVGGSVEPFDCAVCLCEFMETDMLRLLPMCSHAFHMNCIDTWLLSNSTCPLCRGAGFNLAEDHIFDYDDLGNGGNRLSDERKSVEIEEVGVEEGVFPVRLGKFRKTDRGDGEEMGDDGSGSSKVGVDLVDDGGGSSKVGVDLVGDGGGSSNMGVDLARRCYSMGSYEYVVGDENLRVALRRERTSGDVEIGDGKKICNGTRNDSYSVSKIWLWSKRGKFTNSSGGGEGRLENLSSNNLDLDLPSMHEREDV